MAQALKIATEKSVQPGVAPRPADIRIALAGNPNCGKTTAFNKYTGTRQHVGNYPGVTVDRKEGVAHVGGEAVHLIDLPGTYSLTAYSQEEIIARRELTENPPLAVINLVDAAALERNLLLSVQILEMGLPLVLACNMMDEARAAGIQVNTVLLGERLGVPVVETVARTGEGLNAALEKALAFGRTREKLAPLRISYGSDLDPVLAKMEEIIGEAALLAPKYTSRWLAIKVLENDSDMLDELRGVDAAVTDRLLAVRATVADHLRKTLNTTPESIIADFRYGFIKSTLRDGVMTRDMTRDRLALSDKLDKVLANAVLGPIIMVGLIFVMFWATFSVGAYPQGWVEEAVGLLGDALTAVLPEGFLQSLVVSGIIAGVGGVLSFVPLIMIMFLFIAFLEDSGYMARIAYMVDRVFRAFGLHGSSVMPYIIGGGIAGGCAIPGVMATRTLRSPKEKLATLLTLPYMACGAKLPVFLLLAGVFFPGQEASVMMGLILAGWVFALLIARLLRSTIIRGESTPFVMELPPYRMPTLRSLLIHCWERTWMYLKKAGTVLVAISIVIWAGLTFPTLDEKTAAPLEARIATAEERLAALPALEEGVEPSAEQQAAQDELDEATKTLSEESLRNSVAGRLGTALEPVTAPAGFDWRVDVALIGGIAAKEALVSTLGTAYSLGEVDPEDATPLAESLAADPHWSPATALALMLFVLLYSPCFVALVVIRQEAGSWGWVAFSMVFNTLLAFGVAVAAYQIGLRLWA